MTEPIFLQGICKDYLWGGNRLREEFGKESDADKIAESWELACHKDGSSILTSGSDAGLNLREYLDKNGTAFLGTNCADCTTVPVLIKLIDAKQDLSIQVHPDDDYAMRVEGEAGKTEMWYIVDAAPHAALYYGLKQEVTKAEFEQRIHDQTLTEILNRVEVKPGELYFIPSGTLHAIGAGILLAEIQQNRSTYETEEAYNQALANARATIQFKQWRNKCYQDTYEPGSTFKPITLATALEEGVVNMNTTFTFTGSNAGEYTIKAGIEINGTFSAAQIKVTVQADPTSVTVSGPDTATVGNKVTFTANVQNANGDVQWSCEETSWKATGNQVEFTANEAGTYHIRADAVFTLHVNAAPTPTPTPTPTPNPDSKPDGQ